MKTARVAIDGAIHYAYPSDSADSDHGRSGAASADTAKGEETLRLDTGRLVKASEVVWLPPIVPRTAFALGLNYADHAKELAFSAPKEPLVFLKGPNTFVGHRAATVRPSGSQHMHYECELAVVIGRTARKVSRANALDYVRGYTVANDYAVRDYLENYYRPNLRVKNRDTLTPLGPWLVDRDDIADPGALELRTYINGELKQRGNTADMIFDVAGLIEYLSGFMTLEANDVILTGTPEGLADTKVGDEVVTEIEGVGRLVSTIVDEREYFGEA